MTNIWYLQPDLRWTNAYDTYIDIIVIIFPGKLG